MGSQIIHLPDGQHITVKPVFAGLFFKSNELSHDNAFPIGWTIVIHTEDVGESDKGGPKLAEGQAGAGGSPQSTKGQYIHLFRRPSL